MEQNATKRTIISFSIVLALSILAVYLVDSHKAKSIAKENVFSSENLTNISFID